MRKLLSFFIAIQFLLAPALMAQSKEKKAPVKKKPRIQDYFINPQKDFAWMTDKERGAYIAFISSLHVLIESELSADMVVVIPDKFKKSSKLEYWREILNPYLGIEKAEAALPLMIPLGIGAMTLLRAGLPRVLPRVAARKEIFMGPAEIVGSAAAKEGAKTAALTATTTAANTASKWKSIAAVSGTTATVAGLPLMDPQDPPKSSVEVASSETTVPSLPAQVEVTVVPDQGKVTTKPFVPSNRKEGMFCIFGGHSSRYKKVGGKMTCPSPEGTVNSTICKDSGYSPSFLCQSFGLSEKKDAHHLTKNLCVPLRGGAGLMDLTARCSDAFINNFLPAVKSVDTQKLTEIQEALLKGIDALEEERGIEAIGLLEYCENANAVNKRRQQTPCEALGKMMDAVRKDLPTIARHADETAGANPPGQGHEGSGRR